MAKDGNDSKEWLTASRASAPVAPLAPCRSTGTAEGLTWASLLASEKAKGKGDSASKTLCASVSMRDKSRPPLPMKGAEASRPPRDRSLAAATGAPAVSRTGDNTAPTGDAESAWQLKTVSALLQLRPGEEPERCGEAEASSRASSWSATLPGSAHSTPLSVGGTAAVLDAAGSDGQAAQFRKAWSSACSIATSVRHLASSAWKRASSSALWATASSSRCFRASARARESSSTTFW